MKSKFIDKQWSSNLDLIKICQCTVEFRIAKSTENGSHSLGKKIKLKNFKASKSCRWQKLNFISYNFLPNYVQKLKFIQILFTMLYLRTICKENIFVLGPI